jgi:hypothetical protein
MSDLIIDGNKLMTSLADWWYSSFGQEETEEAIAIRKVMDQVEKSLESYKIDLPYAQPDINRINKILKTCTSTCTLSACLRKELEKVLYVQTESYREDGGS